MGDGDDTYLIDIAPDGVDTFQEVHGEAQERSYRQNELYLGMRTHARVPQCNPCPSIILLRRRGDTAGSKVPRFPPTPAAGNISITPVRINITRLGTDG